MDDDKADWIFIPQKQGTLEHAQIQDEMARLKHETSQVKEVQSKAIRSVVPFVMKEIRSTFLTLANCYFHSSLWFIIPAYLDI